MRARTTVHPLAARLIALALAVVTLVPAALGGARFVYCAPMQRAMLHACCPSERGHAPARHDVLDAPCCETRALSSLPTGDPPRAMVPDVPPSPRVLLWTIAAMFPPEVAWPTAQRPSRERRARAGPEAPLYVLHRVWRC